MFPYCFFLIFLESVLNKMLQSENTNKVFSPFNEQSFAKANVQDEQQLKLLYWSVS